MISYLYWTLIVILVVLSLYFIGVKYKKWQASFIIALTIGLLGTLSYYFYFEQLFVKRYGGVMTISVPEGQYHIAATWKYDNLWVESYDPESNTCIFKEYSRGRMLEGQVTIKNCNPVALEKSIMPSASQGLIGPDEPMSPDEGAIE